jgi:hypothetical protein
MGAIFEIALPKQGFIASADGAGNTPERSARENDKRLTQKVTSDHGR